MGIGAWLLAVDRREAALAWSLRIRGLGLAAGALMAMGALSPGGILLRPDDLATAPAWVWIGFAGWLGTYVAYPVWAVAVGMTEGRLASPVRSASAGSAAD